jgi:hypothetical protein
VPLETDEIMNVGYLVRHDAAADAIGEEFLDLLCARCASHEPMVSPSDKVLERTGRTHA